MNRSSHDQHAAHSCMCKSSLITLGILWRVIACIVFQHYECYILKQNGQKCPKCELAPGCREVHPQKEEVGVAIFLLKWQSRCIFAQSFTAVQQHFASTTTTLLFEAFECPPPKHLLFKALGHLLLDSNGGCFSQNNNRPPPPTLIHNSWEDESSIMRSGSDSSAAFWTTL